MSMVGAGQLQKRYRVDSFLHDLKYGARMLLKNPGFTIVAVLTLALGIGANTAIFSVVQRVLLRLPPYQQPESLVQIFNTYFPAWPQLGLSPGDFQDFRRQARSFSEMAAYIDIPAATQGFNLTGLGEPERVQAAYADSNLFPLLGVLPVLGRSFSSEHDSPNSPAVALLTHRFWQSHFGADPTVIGRTITLDGAGYTVLGVLPARIELSPMADVHGVLKEGGRTSATSGGNNLRSALVVSQIALALIPLVGAGLLIRSFHRMLSVDPGFRPDHILTMQVQLPAIPLAQLNKLSNDQQNELARQQSLQFQQMAERIQSLPGVKAVGGINVLPLATALQAASRFLVEGQPAPEAGARPIAQTRNTSLGYFDAVGIPLVKGRLFTPADLGGNNIIINDRSEEHTSEL